MERSEFFQALTLWFVVVIFLQTPSGNGEPVQVAIGIFAIVLLWGIPLYLLAALWSALQNRVASSTR
jgi:hypothetical protein